MEGINAKGETRVLDINKELDQIVFKYHLDRYYPQYKSMKEAEKVLRNVIREIRQNHNTVLFVGKKSKEMEFIRSLSMDYADILFLCYTADESVLYQLENTDWKKYDAVYLVSFYRAEHVERWFRLHDIEYEWIYDTFEGEGIFLQQEFLSFCKENLRSLIDKKRNNMGSLQCEFYCQSSKYRSAKDDRIKRIALEKCVFLLLYMKDFVTAQEYISLLMKEDDIYRQMWDEVQALLYKIKHLLSARRAKDIIIYWLDAIPYGGEDNMPYLQSVMKESIVFENAFTYIPYTKPTLRAMFLGKKDIDDRTYDSVNITQENSPLISFLDEQGYNIKIYSIAYNNCFQSQCQPSRYDWDHFIPASMKLWDMVSDMLCQEQKALWIMHALDAHEPCFNNSISDDDYNDSFKRYQFAKKKLDEQLRFYNAFMGEDAYRIYMSDHGRTGIYKYHILFNINHRTLAPRRIEGLFSILDFTTILKQLLGNGRIIEQEFIKEYVEIGNCDWYSYGLIKELFQKKEALSLKFFGCKGIIDKDYIYIRYNTGKEWLHKRSESMLCEPLLFYECEDDVCDLKLLPQYRALTIDYPQDMLNDEFFRYTRYLYTLYHNILKHNNMNERINVINRMLEDYPDGSVAIRMGGIASSVLYYILSKENKRKIWGFIDKDDKCLCSRLGLPILYPNRIDAAKNAGIKAILFASFPYLHILREEAKTYPMGIDILDIYKQFKESGIRCKEDFYKVSGNDEDYNVGFPLDEVIK